MSDDRFKDEPGKAIVDAMQVELSHADLEEDVDKAGRRFDQACGEWDDADRRWVDALYAAGGVYRDVPKDIATERFKAGAKKRGAAYRLMMAEFTAGTRTLKPCNPDSPDCPKAIETGKCKCSHYYGPQA